MTRISCFDRAGFGLMAGAGSRIGAMPRAAGSSAGARTALPGGRPDAPAHWRDARLGGLLLASVRP